MLIKGWNLAESGLTNDNAFECPLLLCRTLSACSDSLTSMQNVSIDKLAKKLTYKVLEIHSEMAIYDDNR